MERTTNWNGELDLGLMSFRIRLPMISLVVAPLALLAGCPQTGPSLDYDPRVDKSEKVCQLTGKKDWLTDQPPREFPSSFYGLGGTDLGYPVEHNGRLALLFGDTRALPPLQEHMEVGPPDDAVGWITSKRLPTAEECTDLVPNHDESLLHGPEHPRILQSPKVFPEIQQGLFNVPTGGVSNENWLYGFFWTDHCTPRPISKPCPETASLNSIGRGILARSHDDGFTFGEAVAMPAGFVYSTAVDAKAVAGLPADQQKGTYIFGVPIYRASVPYLALARPGTLHDPAEWSFFVGLQDDGQPAWTPIQSWQASQPGKPWRPPGKPELLGASPADRCIGEFSITWNRGLDVWLMLYNCNRGGIEARVAEAPWGPWSEPALILDPSRDGAWCQYMVLPGDARCRGRPDDWNEPQNKHGNLYAPFVMERYTVRQTVADPRMRRAIIYWLVSTWNPYQVIVMRTPLTVFKPQLSVRPDKPVPGVDKG